MTDIILDENGVENMEGHGGKVVGSGIEGPNVFPGAPSGPINVKDMDAIVQKLMAAKGTPEFDVLSQQYEGPDTGVDIDDDNGTWKIADGWHADENGNIVRG